MPFHQTILSFNGGEITPYLAFSTDFVKHASSCARMENFLPMPFGGLRKRPGTYHLATLAATARLEVFQFTGGDRYVFAFQTDRIRVFDPAGAELASLAATFADPFRLQFAQINDYVYVVARDIHPAQIYGGGASWTFEDIPFDSPPMLGQTRHGTGRQLAVGGTEGNAALPGDSVDLTASFPFFQATHVGAFFYLSKRRFASDYERDQPATDATESAELEADGSWYFNTYGTWTGTWTLQRSTDGGTTWLNLRKWTSKADRNVADEGLLDGPCILRIRYDGTTDADARAVVSVGSAFIRGLVKITAVADDTHATATAITRVQKGFSSRWWTEGAFSDRRGYPAAIAVHDRRLIFAGTKNQPMSLWASAIDDLLTFDTGTAKDSAFFTTLAATRQSPIRWMASQRRLFLGTEDSEWAFGSDQSDAPLAPDNLFVREYTRFGSAKIPALAFGDSVYFIERNGLRLRELAYIMERETFDAADLNRLAAHITTSGIVQMAWQQTREPTLWSCTASGRLLAFNYQRQENIAAWSRHSTSGGQFRSVAVLRDDDEEDDVYFLVQRGSNFCLEMLAAGQQSAQETGNLASVHMVDSGVSGATSGGNHELAVPAHLNGLTLTVLADGYSLKIPATSNKIQLPFAAAAVHAGLGYASTFTSLPQDITVDNGTTHGRRKRANELVVNVYQSYGGQLSYDSRTLTLFYGGSSDAMDAAPAMRTGWMPQTLSPAHLEDLVFSIVHAEPYPFIARAAVLRWQVHEP